MKLLLTAEGLSTPAIRQEFLRLVGKPINEVTVAFIPTAADPEPDQTWVEQAVGEVKYLGDFALKESELRSTKTVDVVDLKKFTPRSLLHILTKYDVIWVNGGDTFYLLDWARKSGFDKIIHELLDQGKLYVGASAGSILACPTIETAGWKGLEDLNCVKLQNLQALHLVDFYIFPHSTADLKATLQTVADKLDKPVYFLTNQQAVSVEDKKVKLVD